MAYPFVYTAMKEKQNPRSIESRLANGIYEPSSTVWAVELTETYIPEQDLKAFYQKLRKELSKESGAGKYPLLKFGKVQFGKFCKENTYFLKFSKYSAIKEAHLELGEKNILRLDLWGTKKQVRRKNDWLQQKVGETCEIMEDVLLNRTYLKPYMGQR